MLLNTFDAFWLISSTRIWCLYPHLTSVIFQSIPKAAVLSGRSSHCRHPALQGCCTIRHRSQKTSNSRSQRWQQEGACLLLIHISMNSCFSSAQPAASTDMGKHQPSASLSHPEISNQFPNIFICGFRITLKPPKNCLFLLPGQLKQIFGKVSFIRKQLAQGSPRGNFKRNH